jgi:membrane protein
MTEPPTPEPAPPASPTDGGSDDTANGGDGLLGFLKRVAHAAREDDVPAEGAHVAFFAFLSLPPTLLVAFALTGFFGGEELAETLTVTLQRALPEEASDLVGNAVQEVVMEAAPGPFSIGLVVALWAASNVFVAMSKALNTAYGIHNPRPFLKQRAIGIGAMLLCMVLFFLGTAVLLTAPFVAKWIDLWGTAQVAWEILHWPLALMLLVAGIWLAYLALPARDQRSEKRNCLIGALVAAVLWVIATAGFRLYITTFGQYSQTYGILGTVIVILLWLWVSAMVIVLGGEIAAELRKRRVRKRQEAAG